MLQRLIQCLTVLVLGSIVVIAQDEACVAIVQTAFQSANDNCTGNPINTVCYAHDTVILNPTTASFSTAGDTVLLSEVDTISLAPYDASTGEWGVAVLHVQANLDEAPDAGLRITLFGDTIVSNIDETGSTFDVSSAADDAACDEMPNSGLVISAPPTLAEYEVIINGLTLTAAGTVYITAEAEGDMLILPIGVPVEVGIDGDEPRTVESGRSLAVPLDGDLSPTGDMPETEFAERELLSVILSTLSGVGVIPEDGEFHQEILVVCPDITNTFDGDVWHIFELDGSNLSLTSGDITPMVLEATGAIGVYRGIVIQDITGNVYDVTVTITSADSFQVLQLGDRCTLTGVFTRN